LLLLVLVPVIPALVLALHTYLGQRRSGAALVEKDAVRVVQLAAASQFGLFDATRQHLAALARLPQARNTNVPAFDSFFANMPKIYSDYNDFGLIETNGTLVSSSFGRQGQTNLFRRAEVQRVLKTLDFAVGSYQPGDDLRKPSLVFGHPVFDEKGRLARVLYMALDLAVINKLTAKAEIAKGGVITIFDREGHILARYPEPEKWVGKSYLDSPVAAIVTNKLEGTTEQRGQDGVRRLYAFTPIRAGKDANLFASVGIPTALAYAEIERILLRDVTILTVVALLAVMAAWGYANSQILSPMKALADTTRQVASGDLSARTGLSRASGELKQLARAFDDMTESLQRQRSETERSAQALRESEERVRLVLDTALDAVITIDHTGAVTSWNGEAEKIFGWTRQEIAGRPLTGTIIPARFQASHEHGLDRFLATNEGPVLNKRIEMTALRKNGTEFPVELAITPIRMGTQMIFSAFVRDITERKGAEELIQASLHEKQVLLKEIHHRVKNNMQVVSSLLQLQAGYLQNPQALEAFRESQARIRSMSLIHEKLYQSESLAKIDVADYLRSLVGMLFRSYSTRASTIRLDARIAPIFLSLDTAIPIGLVTHELVSNCLKYAFPDAREAVVRVEMNVVAPGQYALTVEDNGVGLPANFELEKAATLGLRLVQIFTKQVQGKLAWVSHENKTSFTLRFGDRMAK
jgi:PAS domain S-box-containing protein